MAEIRWTLTAADDLKEIENWIARDSVPHAVHFIDRLVEAAGRLASSSKICRVVPEFGRSDLREVVFRDYRIVYLLAGHDVTILRVVHGARDIGRLARRELWNWP